MSEQAQTIIAVVGILVDALDQISNLEGVAAELAQKALDEFYNATRNF